MWKTELRYGIIGGILLCAFKYIEYLPFFQIARLDTGIYTGLFAFVIVITIVILGVKAVRNVDEDTPLTFRQAFRSGMIIAIYMAIIASPFMYFYSKYVNNKEAEHMIQYIKDTRGEDGLQVSNQEIQEMQAYYRPGNRATHTAEDIILTGLFVSLFSAGMFRRTHRVMVDVARKPRIPSYLKKVFLAGICLTLFTLLVYVAWILKYEKVTTILYDFLVEPINPVLLQAGTAVIALGSLVLNIAYYNKVSHYRHRANLWNLLMIIICGAMFFISLWPIL